MLTIFVFYSAAMVVGLVISPLPPARTVWLVSCALLLRLGASFVIPEIVIFDDELTYQSMGTAVANSVESAGGIEWSANAWGSVTGVVYYVFGNSLEGVRALNALLGVATGLLLGRIAAIVYRSRVLTRRVTMWSLCLPPLVFVSSVALKEQAVAFALVLSVLGFVKRGPAGGFLCLAGCLILSVVRTNLAVAVVPLLMAHYVVRFAAATTTVGRRKAVAWTVAVTVVGILAYGATEFELVQQTTVAQVLQGADTRGQEVMSQSRATYARFLDAGNAAAGGNFVMAPLVAVYSPSPLRVVTTPQPAVFLEAAAFTLLIYLATPYFVLGGIKSIDQNEQLVLVTVALAVFVAASLSILTFAPEAFRFRWPGLGLFFAVAAYGAQAKFRWRRKVLIGWWASVAVFGLVYLRNFSN